MKKRVVIYARVSLIDLDPSNQLVPLKRYASFNNLDVAGEFVDFASGTCEDRPQLRKALTAMKTENAQVLLVASIDRLGRSVSHVIRIVEDLRKDGKGAVILRENLDLSGKSPQSDLILHIFSALAQFEAALIAERTRTALAVARLKGKTLGRPTKRNPEVEAQVLDLHAKGISIREISRRVSTISRSTIQMIIKQNKRK